MKRLTLTASLVLAVAVPGSSTHRQHRAFTFSHVTRALGARAAGCDHTCHVAATTGVHVAPVPAMHGPVIASYYNLSGIGSCGVPAQSGYAFASLFLPCGARVLMCHGTTCVTATMDDHGPYVAGRTFDLNVALKDTLGCPDLCNVTWRSA